MLANWKAKIVLMGRIECVYASVCADGPELGRLIRWRKGSQR